MWHGKVGEKPRPCSSSDDRQGRLVISNADQAPLYVSDDPLYVGDHPSLWFVGTEKRFVRLGNNEIIQVPGTYAPQAIPEGIQDREIVQVPGTYAPQAIPEGVQDREVVEDRETRRGKLRVLCDGCGHVLWAPSRWAGRKTRCLHCNAVLKVPGPGEDAGEADQKGSTS